MALLTHNSAFSRVTALAARRSVHAAFSWLHLNPKRIMDWQIELVKIPAPLNGEQARGEWIARRFAEAGLTRIETDAVGNVFGMLEAADLPPESTGPVVLVSAHLDTVFPLGTQLEPVAEGDRLYGPGACDNGAGVVGMLAIAFALAEAKTALPVPLVFMGNVGEEGEGDLRGMRHLYRENPLAGRIAAHIVMDGAGVDTAVTQALGSRRFHVTVQGPGGHSFTDAGTPNPIAAMARALSTLAETPLPEDPRTTLSLGTIRGGTSVNSIPESAEATIDFRSTGVDELVRLEVALHRTVEDAVDHCNRKAKAAGTAGRGKLDFAIRKIGDRPAARLAEDSALLETLRAVDRHLGLHTEPRLGSTDANLPLSVGVPSLSIGAGGDGGGAHTLAEWYSAKDRELGLRRVLLLVLAMVEWSHEQ
jgi:acetylornithine deacetylase/succinyl-diaminopimelate desuccinylase-like protein